MRSQERKKKKKALPDNSKAKAKNGAGLATTPYLKNRVTYFEKKGKSQEVVVVEKEEKKMGRPYTDEVKKTGRLEIRTTPKEEEMLLFCCEQTGKSRADIMRLGLRKVYEELVKKT